MLLAAGWMAERGTKFCQLELAQTLALPSSTAHRLVSTLETVGLLERSADVQTRRQWFECVDSPFWTWISEYGRAAGEKKGAR